MHEKSVDLLNQALADELAAIHQYMYFHFHCDDQGYDPLANLFKQTAIQEMLHAERFGERILFLKGEVEMTPARNVVKGQDVARMLEMAKKLEQDSVVMYNKFANQCSAAGDNVSKRLFEEIAEQEERHCDNFDTQEEHLHKFGAQFLALQSIERSKQLGAQGGAQA